MRQPLTRPNPIMLNSPNNHSKISEFRSKQQQQEAEKSSSNNQAQQDNQSTSVLTKTQFYGNNNASSVKRRRDSTADDDENSQAPRSRNHNMSAADRPLSKLQLRNPNVIPGSFKFNSNRLTLLHFNGFK